jgi:hypothetical protein
MKPAVVMHLTWGAARSLALGAWRAGRAREEFLASFVPEGLVRADREGRRAVRAAGGCLACGACEEPGRSPRGVFEAARGLDHLDEIEERIRSLSSLPARELERLERTCPASIPFGEISSALCRMLDRDSNLG